MRGTRILGCFVAMLCCLGPAWAQSGAIPVWEPGTVISSPGKYVLTRNLISVSNPVVTINSSNVHLDLNGFRIEGDENIFAPDVIRVDNGNGITIENGTVVGGGAGIRLASSTKLFALRNLAIHDGRTGIGTTAADSLGIIENCIIENMVDVGISVSGSSIQIRNNLIRGSAKGISIDQCYGCTARENTVHGATDAAVVVQFGAGNVVVANTIAASGTGIRVRDGGYHQVERNVVTNSTAYGLHLRNTSFDCVYRGNTVRNSGGAGCTGGGSTPDFCNEGSGNTSHGDNYMPNIR